MEEFVTNSSIVWNFTTLSSGSPRTNIGNLTCVCAWNSRDSLQHNNKGFQFSVLSYFTQQLTSSYLDKAFSVPASICRNVPKVKKSCPLLYCSSYVKKLLQLITCYRTVVHSTYVSNFSGYCMLRINDVSGFMPLFKGCEIDGYNNTSPTIRSTILYTRDCLSKICFHFKPTKQHRYIFIYIYIYIFFLNKT